MADEKSTEKLISVLKKQNKTKEKKASAKADKDQQAIAKVQELLKNTPVAPLVGAEIETPKVKEFDQEQYKVEKSQKWLEEQVNELSRQVEEYENEIIFYKNEIEKLNDIIRSGGFKNGPEANSHVVVPNGNPVEASINHNLIELFRHFENLHMKYNHDGNFAVKVSYPITGNGILDKFLEYFPQLQSIKRYQNRHF